MDNHQIDPIEMTQCPACKKKAAVKLGDSKRFCLNCPWEEGPIERTDQDDARDAYNDDLAHGWGRDE